MLKDKEQMNILKDWLRELLREQPVSLTFTKKDGTIRVMRCTLNKDVVPKVEVTEEKVPRKGNDAVQSVWDVEAEGWRSFRWESLTGIEFSLGEK